MSRLLLAQEEFRADQITTGKNGDLSQLRPKPVNPKPLLEGPTEDGWIQDQGKPRPNNRAPPESDDTGTSRPEKFTAGIIAMTMVAKTAATCVRVKVETSCPKPVDAST